VVVIVLLLLGLEEAIVVVTVFEFVLGTKPNVVYEDETGRAVPLQYPKLLQVLLPSQSKSE
jgi:hypothetical protein